MPIQQWPRELQGIVDVWNVSYPDHRVVLTLISPSPGDRGMGQREHDRALGDGFQLCLYRCRFVAPIIDLQSGDHPLGTRLDDC